MSYTSVSNCDVFPMGYRSPHWNRNDTENSRSLEIDYCELTALFEPPSMRPEVLFLFFFHLTQVKISLEIKFSRGIGRKVKIYFFEFFSQYQNTLNLDVSEAHIHSQPSNPSLLSASTSQK